MSVIVPAWHDDETGFRAVIVDENPNTSGLILPKGSIAFDIDTPAIWQSNDSAASDWIQYAPV